MKRAMLVVCVSVCLMGSGCVWNFGNTRVEADVQVNEQSLDVALDKAVETLRRELQRRNLEVTVNPDGDTVRVVTKTKTGDQFTIILSRIRQDSGKEQTQIRVDWSARPDRDLWLGLLLALTPTTTQAPVR